LGIVDQSNQNSNVIEQESGHESVQRVEGAENVREEIIKLSQFDNS